MLLWIGIALAGWTEPTHPDAGTAFNTGVTALDAADPEAAERAFREASALDPSWGRTRLGIALALLRQDRSSDATAVLTPLSVEFPDQTMVWTHLSQARFAARDIDGARAAAAQGLALDPADVLTVSAMVDVHLRTGDLEAADGALDAAAVARPSPDWSCLRTRVAVERADLDALDGLLKACDGGDAALVRNAWSAASSARGTRVTVDIGAAGHMVAQANQAILLLRQGLTEEAAALADRLVDAHPRDVRVHIVRGRIAYVAGDIPTAIRHYEQAFAGDDWVEIHDDGVRTGILTATQAQEWEAMATGAAATLAAVYAEQGRAADAATLLIQAKDRFGEQPAFEIARAWIAFAQNQPAEAWDALARGLSDPQGGVVDSLASELLFQRAAELPEPMAALLAGVDGHSSVLVNAAAGLTNAGRGAVALPLVEKVWDEALDRALAVGIGYTAAVQVRELESLKTWHDRAVAVNALDPVTLRNHAVVLLDGEHHTRVLALLDAHPSIPDAPTFRVIALVELEQTSGLEAAALAEDVDPSARFNAAVVLGNSGDTAAAARVLEATCPEMSGGNQVSCEETLAAWRG